MLLRFFQELNDHELLTIKKYRWDELSTENRNAIEALIQKRELALAEYEQLSKIEMKRNHGKHKCPYCYSTKILLVEENITDFRSFFMAFRYYFPDLKLRYICQVCGQPFRSWITINQIINLLKKY